MHKGKLVFAQLNEHRTKPIPVVVAIVKKRLAFEGSMHAILQVLSLSLFEVKPLAELLGEQLLNDETG
jgi:hypothetical protein